LIGGLSTYVTKSVVSLLTIRQLGLLNNQQAIEISKQKYKTDNNRIFLDHLNSLAK